MSNHIGDGIFEVGVKQIGWFPTSIYMGNEIDNLWRTYHKLLDRTRDKDYLSQPEVANEYDLFCDNFIGLEEVLQNELGTDYLVFFKTYLTDKEKIALQYTITDMIWDGDAMSVISSDVSVDDLADSTLTVSYMDDLIYG